MARWRLRQFLLGASTEVLCPRYLFFHRFLPPLITAEKVTIYSQTQSHRPEIGQPRAHGWSFLALLIAAEPGHHTNPMPSYLAASGPTPRLRGLHKQAWSHTRDRRMAHMLEARRPPCFLSACGISTTRKISASFLPALHDHRTLPMRFPTSMNDRQVISGMQPAEASPMAIVAAVRPERYI